MNFIALQNEIEKFIGKFGTLTLIQYIKDFNKNVPNAEHAAYRELLVKEVCSVYKVSSVDVENLQNKQPDVVDARRQIVYIGTHDNSIPTAVFEVWLNCSKRTIYHLRNASKEMLANERHHKPYNEKYKIIKEIIKNV